MSPRLTIQPTELERENLHNLDVGDDYHLQGDAKWETERKRVERERLQASAKIRAAPPEEVIAQAGISRIEWRARR